MMFDVLIIGGGVAGEEASLQQPPEVAHKLQQTF
jgi:anaerobic glycerol-3-phosphate dehydrogenase